MSPLLSGVSGVHRRLPVLLLGVGGIIGGKLLRSIEINNLELAFIPRGMGNFINIITVTGIVLGLVVKGVPKSRFSLSTLFFLTPLIYGSLKVFAPFKKRIGLLDYGWLEPYFFVKNKFYFRGSTLREVSR